MATRKNGKTNGHAPPEGAAVKPGWDPRRDFTDTAGEMPPSDEELLAEGQDLAADTLTGDIRDFILDRLRHEQSKRPWHERSESDQRQTVHDVEAVVQRLVRTAVDLIAGHGRRAIRAHLEQVTIKDGIKAVLTMPPSSEERHKLYDAQGFDVLVVVADPEEFTGERAPVAISPDQPTLPTEVVHSAAEDNHAEAPFH